VAAALVSGLYRHAGYVPCAWRTRGAPGSRQLSSRARSRAGEGHRQRPAIPQTQHGKLSIDGQPECGRWFESVSHFVFWQRLVALQNKDGRRLERFRV